MSSYFGPIFGLASIQSAPRDAIAGLRLSCRRAAGTRSGEWFRRACRAAFEKYSSQLRDRQPCKTFNDTNRAGTQKLLSRTSARNP